jgi:hypothetical protein
VGPFVDRGRTLNGWTERYGNRLYSMSGYPRGISHKFLSHIVLLFPLRTIDSFISLNAKVTIALHVQIWKFRSKFPSFHGRNVDFWVSGTGVLRLRRSNLTKDSCPSFISCSSSSLSTTHLQRFDGKHCQDPKPILQTHSKNSVLCSCSVSL